MRPSHVVAAILGFVACVAIYLSDMFDDVGADIKEQNRRLWIYTPDVEPGGRVLSQIVLTGGERIMIAKLEATIDGKSVETRDVVMTHSQRGRRFKYGYAEAELAVLVPKDVAPGEHDLAFRIEAHCTTDSATPPPSCGSSTLLFPLRVVESATLPRGFAVLRALFAAIVVFVGVRLLKRPVAAWVNSADNPQSGKLLGTPAIAALVLWAWSGHPLFAKPLAAAFGTSSTAFFVVAILVWLAIPIPALRHGRSRRIPEPVVIGPDPSAIVRFTAPKDGGYRGGAIAQHDLDAVARVVRDAYGLRFRRKGDRLVPRWWKSAPVTFVQREGGFEMTGSRDHHLLFAVVAAKKLGPLDLEIEARTVHVDETSTPESVARELREQGVPA
jgi:hypothetical protein